MVGTSEQKKSFPVIGIENKQMSYGFLQKRTLLVCGGNVLKTVPDGYAAVYYCKIIHYIYTGDTTSLGCILIMGCCGFIWH